MAERGELGSAKNRSKESGAVSDSQLSECCQQEKSAKSHARNMRRYHSCPSTEAICYEEPAELDFDALLKQEEEQLQRERLQFYLRMLELERKKIQRLSRSRKYDNKSQKQRITTLPPVSPV